ncbi:hypothetical protein D3C76_1381840 [compost metagenome]
MKGMPRVVPDPNHQLAADNAGMAAPGKGAQVILIQIGQRATGAERLTGRDIEIIGRTVADNQFHPHAAVQGVVDLAHHHSGRVEIRRADDDL